MVTLTVLFTTQNVAVTWTADRDYVLVQYKDMSYSAGNQISVMSDRPLDQMPATPRLGTEFYGSAGVQLNYEIRKGTVLYFTPTALNLSFVAQLFLEIPTAEFP